MKNHEKYFSINMMCRVFEVSRSGYYDWKWRKPSSRDQKQTQQEVAIRAAHQQTRETYGARRLHKELRSQGHSISLWKVRQLKKQLGLRCKQVKKFKATTNSAHELPVVPNRLDQCFEAQRPNQVWLTDITYVATQEGWLYLAAIKDMFTREIVGYAQGSTMSKELVISALQGAIKAKRPPSGLIHHSDRGSQYCSKAYQCLLKKAGMVASMSRKGNCYDNAPMESFWGSLKNELIHHKRYATRDEASAEIVEYIEVFYNRQRRHSGLNGVSPAVFCANYWRSQKQAA
jgi:putative transposase